MPTTETTPIAPSASGGWFARHSSRPAVLWTAFALVHILLAVLCLFAPGLPMGDVSIVYKEWMRTAVAGDGIMGIDHSFVYPVVAFIPIALAWLFGPSGYDLTWLLIVTALDVLGFRVLLGSFGGPLRRVRAAWYWLLFLVLLGPISLGRIDAITVPLAVIGMLWIVSRPTAATIVLALATWIKVWPAAILLAAVVASRNRLRIVVVAAAFSALVVAIALVLGSGANVFSFVGDQTERGLQVEAPVSTIWVWLSLFGVANAFVFYDKPLNTFEVAGDGTTAAAMIMSPLLAVGVIVLVLLGVLAVRAGARSTRVVTVLALAVTVALIAVNKVGSPQYVVWLVVPIVVGLVHSAERYRTPARLVLVIAALTQVIYPYLYVFLLYLNPAMVVVLTVRNALFFVVLGWCVRELVRLMRAPEHTEPADSLAS